MNYKKALKRALSIIRRRGVSRREVVEFLMLIAQLYENHLDCPACGNEKCYELHAGGDREGETHHRWCLRCGYRDGVRLDEFEIGRADGSILRVWVEWDGELAVGFYGIESRA